MGMGPTSYSKLIQEDSGSVNDAMIDWSAKPLTYTFIKNDIIKYKGFFWYALKNHVKTAQTEPDTTSGEEYWGGVLKLKTGQKISKFVWAPSYTSTVQHKPSVTTIRFGNGYEQRITKSINPDLKTMQLTFDQRTSREARAIVHFLKDKAASRAFAYDPKDIYSDSSYRTRFVCREWETTFTFKENYSIKAKFEEVSA